MAGMSEAMKFSPSPKPDHHAARIADAGGYDLIGFFGGHQHDDVRTLDLVEGFAGGLFQ
jgi:hypothetical protein